MKRNKFNRISLPQRYQIEALLKVNLSVKEIADQLDLHRSSVYREINRNSQLCGGFKMKYRYRASFAHRLCLWRENVKEKHIRFTYSIKRRIRWLIKSYWSPEQIFLVCKKRNTAMVSIESIYLWLYELKRNGEDLCIYLRRRHRKRRKRKLSKQSRQIIKNKTNISKRHQAVELQKRIGDYEADLMKCKNGYLLTITDRASLFNIIEPIYDKSSQSLKEAFIKAMKPFKSQLLTVTSDNGTEFARHEQIAKELNFKWYFADTYSPQQRGCNENQNGLIRQFASRKTDLNNTTYETIKKWQKILNYRPRKKINMDKPINVFLKNLNVALAS